MNILITGASGLIGTALIERLRSSKNLLICQSRKVRADQSRVKWVKHDLRADSWECLDTYEIDVVYHLAGQTSVYVAKERPLEDLYSNVLGLLGLMEYFRVKEKRPFVVLAGTATEVGVTVQLPINESLPDCPLTFYDVSKLTAEMYLKQYVREGLANGCALRLPNVFGRSQPGQQNDRGILDKIFSQALACQTIKIYGDGNYLRDYLFIDDVVSALIAAEMNRERTNGRAFYLGSGEGVALKDAFLKVASIASKAVGAEVRYTHVPLPVGLSEIEFRNAVIDASAFSLASGWKPRYSFDAAIEAAYQPCIQDPAGLKIPGG